VQLTVPLLDDDGFPNVAVAASFGYAPSTNWRMRRVARPAAL
jgi:hypothetical protein